MNGTNTYHPAIFHMTDDGYSAFIPDIPEIPDFDDVNLDDLFYQLSIKLGPYFDNDPGPSSCDGMSGRLSDENEFVCSSLSATRTRS